MIMLDKLLSLASEKHLLVILLILFASFIIRKLYFIVDYFNKTDLENRIFYQGKATVDFFILFLSMSYLVLFLVSWFINFQEKGLSGLYSIILAALVSFVLTSILGIIFIVINLFVKIMMFYIYDIQYYLLDNEEEWLILKVTRKGQVILKKADQYRVLKSDEELYDKKIKHKVITRFKDWSKKKIKKFITFIRG